MCKLALTEGLRRLLHLSVGRQILCHNYVHGIVANYLVSTKMAEADNSTYLNNSLSFGIYKCTAEQYREENRLY